MEKEFEKVNAKRIVALLVLSGIVLLNSCSSGKYLSGFNPKASSGNTLTIVSPFVFVSAKSSQANKEDKELNTALERSVFNEANSKLSSKYTIAVHPDTSSEEASEKQLRDYFRKLDDLESSTAKVPYALQPLSDSISGRYAVVLCLFGHYNPNADPYANYKNSNAMGGDVLLVPLNAKTLHHASMHLLVMDNLTGNILYYNKKKSSKIDPRITKDIIDMTSSLVKPIYYWK